MHPLLLPCTKTRETPVCKLQEHLELCNDLLQNVKLQLREDDDDVGELRLVRISLSQMWPKRSWAALEKSDVRTCAALSFLNRLLVQHRCVVSLELDGDVAVHDVFLRALESSTSVKSLVVYDFYRSSSREPDLSERCLSVITSLPNIEKISFRNTSWLPKHCALSSAFRIDRAKLVELDVADLRLSQSDAVNFVSMLISNDTVTDLAVGTSVFTLTSTESSVGFIDFLANARSRLRKLCLKCVDFCSTAQLERLVGAVAAVATLEEFLVDMAIYGSEGTAVFADVVARNATLRTLSVTLPRWWDVSTFNDHISGEPHHRDDRVRRWASAFTSNSTLTDFTIDMLGCGEEECHGFFHALATSTGLRRVTVLRLLNRRCVNAICRTIRQSNLSGKVIIKDHELGSTNISELPECAEVVSVSLYGSSSSDIRNICRELPILASCAHISTLCINLSVDCLNNPLYAALSSYTRAANKLRDLQLHIVCESHIQSYSLAGEKLLASVLSSGITFRRFTYHGPQIGKEHCRLLSAAIHCSRTLQELSFSISCEAVTKGRFLHYLAPMATENYHLLRVFVDAYHKCDEDMKIVAEVARRNSSLVTRAACFVMGNRTNYCARAIEFVSGHAGLAELVQKKASVDETQAKDMVRRALASITSLNEYMKVAGVVKDSVECIVQQTGQVQLDQLNEYCWRHIRLYIKVADIVQI
ncbi:hypothetical protein MTO96_044183 [Rhipicephalus appendiculatus]